VGSVAEERDGTEKITPLPKLWGTGKQQDGSKAV